MATKFEADITKAIDEGVFAGVAIIAVDKTGTRKYAKALGKTSVGEEPKSMKLDSTMWLASCTKISTAVACMQCVERGLLSLDEPIGKILPEWSSPEVLTGYDVNEKPILKKVTKPLTLRHLLTHSAGMAYAGFNPQMDRYLEAIRKPQSPPQRSIKNDFGGPAAALRARRRMIV